MNSKLFRSVTAVTLAVCLLLSVCCITYAAGERTIASTSSSFVRTSRTKGLASITAVSSNPSTPYVTSKMTLQEAPLGTDDFEDSDVDPSIKTIQLSSIQHEKTFSITTTKEYRVKIEVTDITNGVPTTLTIYELLQE